MNRSAKVGIIVAIVAVVAVVIGLVVYFNGQDDDGAVPSADATSDTSNSADPTPSVPTEAPKKLKPESKLTDPRELEAGGEVRIVSMESVTSEASIPGEVAGPAIRVTIKVVADDKPLDLGLVVVNAYFGDDLTPAITGSGPGVKAFKGRLKAGESFEGVQVFNIPTSGRDKVTIEFIHSGTEKPLKFQGSVS